MISVNVVPTYFTFNTIINGLCKVGHPSEANRKGDVEEKNFVGRVFFFFFIFLTYNSIVDGLV